MSNFKFYFYFIFYQLLDNWRGEDAQLTSCPRHQPDLPPLCLPRQVSGKSVASHRSGTPLPVKTPQPSPAVTLPSCLCSISSYFPQKVNIPQMQNGWQPTLKGNDHQILLEVLILTQWHQSYFFLLSSQSLIFQHNKVNQTTFFPYLTILREKYLFLDKQMNNEPIQYSPTTDNLGTVNQSPVLVFASQRGGLCLLSIWSHRGLSSDLSVSRILTTIQNSLKKKKKH